jgi:hypothetical protein
MYETLHFKKGATSLELHGSVSNVNVRENVMSQSGRDKGTENTQTSG